MQLHNLQPKTKNKQKKRVGRGGLRGKTSGRGHKGQKAHGGHNIRPEIRDIIKRLPKKRGYGKNRARTVNDSRVKPIPVNLAILEKTFSSGDKITPKILKSKGIIRPKKGKLCVVKILGNGTLTKKLSISRCRVSKTAFEQIQKVGGSIE